MRNRIDVSPRWDPWHTDPSLTFLASEDVNVADNVLDPTFRDRATRVEGDRMETVRIAGWK